MAQKQVILPEIGKVVLAKRKDAKYIRLSVTASGQVRVGLPIWAPYGAGIKFAQTKTDWIKKQLEPYSANQLKQGDNIGKNHNLHFIMTKSDAIKVRLAENRIYIKTALPISHKDVQSKARHASERALKNEAEILLADRTKLLAATYGLNFKQIKIRKLSSRWGSCTNGGVITLSFFLVQLPWELIDYVIMHELTHTQHLNHGPQFWAALQQAIPDAKQRQKRIKLYRPYINSPLNR
jgi:predicted metal-dependent hydrolase